MTARLAELWRLLPASARHAALRLTGLSLVAALTELATFAALAAFLARLSSAAGSLAIAAGLFAVAALVSGVVRLWLAIRTANLAADVSHSLGVDVQRRLLHQPLAFHTSFSSAGALAAVDKVQLLSGGVLRPLVALGQAIVIGGALTVALLATAPLVAVMVIVLLAAAYVLIAKFSFRRIAAAQPVLGDAYEARTRTVQESFAGVRDIILDHLQEQRADAFRVEDRRLQGTMAMLQAQSSAPRYLIEGLGMALLGLLVVVLAGRGIGTVVSSLGLIAFAVIRLLPLCGSAYASWQSWTAHRQVIDDIGHLLSLPLEADKPGATLPFRQSVALRDVVFAYPDGPPVLRGASIRIARGERVGLRGATGMGKSTVGDILMGLLKPGGGSLIVDGRIVSRTEVGRWQGNIAHVGQHLFLLDAPLAENVAFGDLQPDRERVQKALSAASLDELASRIDEPVGERGVRLSGGQRQRLALARAIYKDAPLLVLDEATSALDEATEATILARFGRDKTLFIISHRPAILSMCDRVVELRDGRLSDVR